MAFNDIQQEALGLLTRDLPGAIAWLQRMLPPTALRQDELLLLLARYNEARKLSAAGVADTDKVAIMENAVRRDLLELIRDLKPAEFDPPATTGSGDDKPSNLLYRIPHAMPLQQETLCVVRIATDPGVLVEDFKVDEHTEQRRIKKISKSMMVEINDPSGGRNFAVRPTSRSVQTIDLGGEEYTEWRIYVTPLREGEHLLELKVCVIELVDGEKEVRERVLEEQVQVVANGAVPGLEAAVEKQAGTALAFSTGSTGDFQSPQSTGDFQSPPPNITPPPSSVTPPAPAVPPQRSVGGSNSPLRTASFFLAFLLVGSSIGWGLTPEVKRDWWMANLQGTEEAYSGFIAEHESNHEYCEKAYFKRAVLSENPKTVRGYLEYLDEYSEIKAAPGNREKVIEKLESMERKALLSVAENPNLPAIEHFLEEYPNTTRLEVIRRIGERDPKLEAPVRQLIQGVMEKKQEETPHSELYYPEESPQYDSSEVLQKERLYLKKRPVREKLRDRVEEQ